MRHADRYIALAAWALTLVFASAASAQQWPALDQPSSVEKASTDDVAVLVGIEDYAFLPDVEGARANTAEWERFLRHDLGLRKVLVLTDGSATREEILTMVDRAAAESTPGSRVWFVFVGHGAPAIQDGEPLVIGVDGQKSPNSIVARGVKQTELLARLSAGSQAKTIAIFDACFSGKTSDGDELVEGVQPVMPAVQSAPPDKTVVMTASSGEQVAGRLPGSKRPAFSYLVLGGLRGWADDGDGNVTAREAVEFARVELLAVPGRTQTPQLHGDGDATLAVGASEARPTILLAGNRANVASISGDSNSAPNEADPTVLSDTDASEAADAEKPTGEFNFPFLARVSAGASGVASSPAQSFAAELGVGYKFAGPSALEFRAITSLRVTGFEPHRSGDQVLVRYDNGEASATLSPVDPVVDRDEGLISVSLGPGVAWRDGVVNGLPNHLVSLDVFGFGGLLYDFCPDTNYYQTSEIGAPSEIRCTSGDYYTLGLGARFGYTWKFLDAGFNVLYGFENRDVIITSTVGVALDP